ncbi:MAG: BTAD domain-containing putative transcriptional regulator [Micromonosporaceae bacterium]
MDRAGEAPVELAVLGMVQLAVDRRHVPLTRLERTLLAGLAVADGHPVSTSALSEWIWGDQPHASPRNRVQALVSGIRRKAGAVIRTEGSAYRLSPEVGCDLAELVGLRRRLSRVGLDTEEGAGLARQAAALVGGVPLDGCLDSPLVELRRTHLEEEALQVLGDRIEADIAAGQLGELAAELTMLTEQHPLHETFVGQLMRVRALTGRQADALTLYRRTYQQAIEALGVPPSDLLGDLHQRILRGEIAPPSQTAGPGQAPSGYVPPTPRTVPRAVAHVVGRDAELAAITKAATRSGNCPPVVSLTGFGGVGKSTLAIESAHLLRDQFPGGSLYLDMNSETGRAGPAQVLAHFLRLLGVSGEGVPEGLDARAALFRSVIDDKRLLIVLDDLPDDFDVSQLLPARATSMAILTSRRPVTGAAPTLQLRLTTLTTASAVRLLGSLLGEPRVSAASDGATRLAEACGGLPLLLRVMAQRLVSRPDLDLAQAAELLSDEIAGRAVPVGSEAAVLAGLGIAEAPLSEPARTLLRRIASLPLPSCSRWVYETLAASEAGGERALDELMAAGLVDVVSHEGAEPQYRLHDLVRLHAGGAPPGVRRPPTALVTTVADRLLTLTEEHAQTFPVQWIPAPPRIRGHVGRAGPPSGPPTDRPSPEAALRFFRTEHENLVVTAREVAAADPGLGWRLLALSGNHVHTTLDLRQWLSAAGEVLLTLSRDQPDGARGRSYLALIEASLRHEWADSTTGIRLADRARRTLTRHRDTPGALVAAVILGRAYRATGERARAERVLTWADRRAAGAWLPTRGYLALAWGSLCNDYERLEPALAYYRKAVSLFQDTDDWFGLATSLGAVGLVSRRLGQYAAGLPLYDDATALFTRLGDTKGQTAMLDGKADLVNQMGDPAGALPVAEEAVRRAERARDRFLLHRAQRTLGRTYAGLDRGEEAEATLRASAAGFEAMGRPLSLAAALRDLALLRRAQHRYDDARQLLLRERECLAGAGVEDLAEVELLLAGLDERSGLLTGA